MDRPDFVLAAIALQEPAFSMSPVQVQKFFFILDREISEMINGPFFQFEPYDYGPFDAAVYQELGDLEKAGLARTAMGGFVRRYQLTDEGLEKGRSLAESLSPAAREYILSVGNFIRRQSFQSLVSAVYKQYPDMRTKSIFRE